MADRIPIFVTVRDRLTPLLQLLEWLEAAGHDEVYLVDNASTYPPLVDFLHATTHRVLWLNRNLGHRAAFLSGAVQRNGRDRPFVVTDPDVVPDAICPLDAVGHLAELLDRFPDADKIGLGLRIDDLPASYALREDVIDWEGHFWLDEIAHGVYRAGVDTTFALHRPLDRHHEMMRALRTGLPYVARHLPWYVDSANPTDEDVYYRDHADRTISNWDQELLPWWKQRRLDSAAPARDRVWRDGVISSDTADSTTDEATAAPAEGDHVVRRATTLLAGVALLICTGGPTTYLALHVVPGAQRPTSWLNVYPFGAVAVVGIVLLWSELRAVRCRRVPVPIVVTGLFVGWVAVSAFWSVSPTVTPIVGLIGAGIAAFGCWFGWSLRGVGQIWAVAIAACSTVVASAAVIWLRPDLGKMFAYGVATHWQGIFGNRNSLAPMCTLGLMALGGLVALRPRPRRIVVSSLLAVVHVVLLRGSGGETAAATLPMLVLVLLVLFASAGLRRARVPGLVVGLGAGLAALIGGWLAVANLGALATWVGRDPSLTGRRLIWHDVRGFIAARPVAGYGFGAFWDSPSLTAASYARLRAAYGSAHNSPLEVMLGTGVVGLILYLFIVGAGVVGVACWTWKVPSVISWWWALLVAYLLVLNTMESFVLWHSYNWVLVVAASCVWLGVSARPSARTTMPRPVAVAVDTTPDTFVG